MQERTRNLIAAALGGLLLQAGAATAESAADTDAAGRKTESATDGGAGPNGSEQPTATAEGEAEFFLPDPAAEANSP